jgi:hypothetical protein
MRGLVLLMFAKGCQNAFNDMSHNRPRHRQQAIPLFGPRQLAGGQS